MLNFHLPHNNFHINRKEVCVFVYIQNMYYTYIHNVVTYIYIIMFIYKIKRKFCNQFCNIIIPNKKKKIVVKMKISTMRLYRQFV